jgi:hypothetical protein
MQSSNVYSKLGERMGLVDHQAVLTVMLQKVATNLKVYGSSEQLVHLTLGLFQVRGWILRAFINDLSLQQKSAALLEWLQCCLAQFAPPVS